MTESEVQVDGSWSPGLGANDVQLLLEIVGDTLKWSLSGDAASFSFDAYARGSALDQRLGNFVTLYHAAELRGCIGTLYATEKLYLSAHENTVHAAHEDRRFKSIEEGDLNRITYTVSVLSELREIESLSDFRLGAQGLSLRLHDRSAVFLPSVPIEQKWDARQTAEGLCRKAGLPLDAWQEDSARFEVFDSVMYASTQAGADDA